MPALPQDLFMVMRVITLLRGLMASLGVDVSSAQLWRPLALQTLADLAPAPRGLRPSMARPSLQEAAAPVACAQLVVAVATAPTAPEGQTRAAAANGPQDAHDPGAVPVPLMALGASSGSQSLQVAQGRGAEARKSADAARMRRGQDAAEARKGAEEQATAAAAAAARAQSEKAGADAQRKLERQAAEVRRKAEKQAESARVQAEKAEAESQRRREREAAEARKQVEQRAAEVRRKAEQQAAAARVVAEKTVAETQRRRECAAAEARKQVEQQAEVARVQAEKAQAEGQHRREREAVEARRQAEQQAESARRQAQTAAAEDQRRLEVQAAAEARSKAAQQAEAARQRAKIAEAEAAQAEELRAAEARQQAGQAAAAKALKAAAREEAVRAAAAADASDTGSSRQEGLMPTKPSHPDAAAGTGATGPLLPPSMSGSLQADLPLAAFASSSSGGGGDHPAGGRLSPSRLQAHVAPKAKAKGADGSPEAAAWLPVGLPPAFIPKTPSRSPAQSFAVSGAGGSPAAPPAPLLHPTRTGVALAREAQDGLLGAGPEGQGEGKEECDTGMAEMTLRYGRGWGGLHACMHDGGPCSTWVGWGARSLGSKC